MNRYEDLINSRIRFVPKALAMSRLKPVVGIVSEVLPTSLVLLTSSGRVKVPYKSDMSLKHNGIEVLQADVPIQRAESARNKELKAMIREEVNKYMDAVEAGVKEGLVKMGWTPPGGLTPREQQVLSILHGNHAILGYHGYTPPTAEQLSEDIVKKLYGDVQISRIHDELTFELTCNDPVPIERDKLRQVWELLNDIADETGTPYSETAIKARELLPDYDK